MAQRIEEVFRTIAPKRRGTPTAPAIQEGIASSGSELAASMSQAAREIAQLRAAYQQEADLISANTQAVQNNTSSHGSSAASTVGHVASSLFGGGALGILSPIISGIAGLFGGGGSTPPALPVYTAPQPVEIDGLLRAAPPAGQSPSVFPGSPAAQPATGVNQTTSYAPQITVNVNAMDSQSFMDRSSDIANAVREAMLNNHPINGVVADL